MYLNKPKNLRVKFFLILLFFFPATYISAQKTAANELYRKIESYYLQNPGLVEYVEFTHKDPLRYDTSRSWFAYVPTSDKSVMIVRFAEEYFIKEAFWAGDDNYFLDGIRAEKIKIKNKELAGSDYANLDYIPSYNYKNLEKVFGSVKSYNKARDQFQILTSKYLLKVDTFTYRINSVTCYDMFQGKVVYNQYRFMLLPDSIQKSIREQAEDLIEGSRSFPVTTYKELQKKRVQVESFEGKKFAFQNLTAFNTGYLDSTIKNKYVIFDFFYQSCFPCHKMTGWILEWIPTIDTSKIILIGIDGTDAEQSMKLFVKARRINYPIIIGQQARDIIKHYDVHSFPTLFLLSPDGTIQNIHEGMSKSFLTKAEKIVSR